MGILDCSDAGETIGAFMAADAGPISFVSVNSPHCHEEVAGTGAA